MKEIHATPERDEHANHYHDGPGAERQAGDDQNHDASGDLVVAGDGHVGAAPSAGIILPPGDGFERVNKVAHKGIWPDAPIRKQQAFADDLGMHYSVQIRDADGHWHLASSKGKLLTPSYLLVPNTELKAMAEEVALLTGYRWRPRREFFDGTRYLYLLVSDDFQREVAPGDAVRAGILAKQAYDGSQRAAVEVYVERLVCANGMRVADGLFQFQFEHKRGAGLEGDENGGQTGREAWRGELARAGYQLRHLAVNFERFVDALARLREVAVGHNEMRRFTTRLPQSFPKSTYGEIVRRFYEAEEATAFGLLNACTYVTWHRGDRATIEDYRRNEMLVELLTGFSAN